MEKTGIIKDCFSPQELLYIKTLLRKAHPEPLIQSHSKTWTSDANSKIYPLLLKKLQGLQEHFDPMKFCVINYTECNDAFGIHFDDWQTWKWGDPYRSILLPMSENKDLKTFVFDLFVEKNEQNKNINVKVKDYLKDFPEGETCFEPGMEHLDTTVLKKIKLLKSLPWQKNSALYWDSLLLHAGCSIKEKKFIIIHTVRER